MAGALFLLAVASSLALMTGAFLPLAGPLLVLAALMFLAAILGAALLAVAEGRRTGIGAIRALAAGISASIRWIVAFLPA